MLVAQWGNSLGVRLPRQLVDKLGLKPGDRLEIVDALPGQLHVISEQQKAEAIAQLAALKWDWPSDFRFDREEANSR
jgi:antitoxin MazE